MPQTRHAQPGAPLRQERWASSPAHDRGFKANLVARRCRVVDDANVRELIWFVQACSHERGGLSALAAELRAVHNYSRYTDVETVVEWLTEFCLNPDETPWADFEAELRECAEIRAAKLAGLVVTRAGRELHSALEYALDQRCMVVVEGVARLGKTYAASSWCEARPGRVRYVQCPSTNDDAGFFAAVARAVGLTVEQDPKVKNLRTRVESALQGGDLMLVIDEAHNCWPSYSYRNTRPPRICWLMTALVNFNVPVVLIVTPQFFRSQQVCEERIGWASEQFVGRIGDYVKLPEELGIEDLRAVARVHLPEGDSTSIEALALYAGSSQKYLAAIEHAVKKARYLAGKAGRSKVIQADVRAAIESGIVPSDSALAGALRNAGRTAAREPAASTPRVQRGQLAPDAGRGMKPGNFTGVVRSGSKNVRGAALETTPG